MKSNLFLSSVYNNSSRVPISINNVSVILFQLRLYQTAMVIVLYKGMVEQAHDF